MHSSVFFRHFPPPKYLLMKHAGLEISDDAIRFLSYKNSPNGLVIEQYDSIDVPENTIIGGDFKNQDAVVKILSDLDKKNNIDHVSVSLPEEKVYLFETDVTGDSIKSITQNIESKIEENVPLSAQDAVFYFDLMPVSMTGGVLRASVSVSPKSYVEKLMSIIRQAGMIPVSFETAPKSIARAMIDPDSQKSVMIVHTMNKKAGIYIVFGGTVCFASTLSFVEGTDNFVELSKEINRVYAYWMSHNPMASIEKVMLLGKSAASFKDKLQNVIAGSDVPVILPNIWNNVFDIEKYTPPIDHDNSLDYAVVAGLALDQ